MRESMASFSGDESLAALGVSEKDIVCIWNDATVYKILSLQESLDPPVESLRITTAHHLSPLILEAHAISRPSYLQGVVYVVVSTLSGTGLALVYFERVLAPLLNTMNVVYTTVYTTSPDSVKDLAASLKGGETVILLSGDGGVVDIINNIAGGRPIIILFPLGTGNALANSTQYDNAVRILLRGSPKPLPIFQASFSMATTKGQPISSLLGAVVASYGFHATLIAESDTPEYRAHGSQRFSIVARELLNKPRKYLATVNGEQMQGYVVITLVSHLEKHFTISPDSRPLDGVLWMVHHGDIMPNMAAGYAGNTMQGYSRVEKVRIDFAEEAQCCIDGSIIMVAKGGWMEVKRTQPNVDLVL